MLKGLRRYERGSPKRKKGQTYACFRLSAMILSAISGCAGSLSFPFLDTVAILVWDGSCIVGEGMIRERVDARK